MTKTEIIEEKANDWLCRNPDSHPASSEFSAYHIIFDLLEVIRKLKIDLEAEISVSDMLKISDSVNEEYARLIKEYENIKNRILHCENCGASSFDDGWHVGCPFCQMKELKDALQRIN